MGRGLGQVANMQMCMFRMMEMVVNHELLPTAEGHWLHRCGESVDGVTCCQSIEDTQHKFSLVLLRICLRARPVVASLSRWTKSGPMSDWYVLTIVVLKVYVVCCMY